MKDESHSPITEESAAPVAEQNRPLASLSDDDLRRLYAREAFPSMFAYCTKALHLSTAAASTPSRMGSSVAQSTAQLLEVPYGTASVAMSAEPASPSLPPEEAPVAISLEDNSVSISPDASVPNSPRAARHIPAAVRRAVRERDGNRCRFVDATGRRCDERHRLEYHHGHPFGVGGDHRPEGILLMCKRHNGYLAECDYGREAMARFRRPRGGVSTSPPVREIGSPAVSAARVASPGP